MPATDTQLLTVADVMWKTHLSRDTILRAIHTGKLPAQQLSDKTFFMTQADVDAWLASRQAPTT